LTDFKQNSSRSLELDKEIIVQLCKFLKEEKNSTNGKGLYEALFWLNRFVGYFEKDYNLWMEDCKDIINEPSENLSEEDQMIKREQKKFLNIMF